MNVNVFNFSLQILFKTFFILIYLGGYTSANHVGRLVGVYCEDLKELECETMDWIQLAKGVAQWYALMNIVMNLQVPQK